MDYSKFIDDILGVEGGYTNHPSDKGGPTNWGITEATARANGYTGDMKHMPREFAEQVYVKRYITGPNFHKVALISEEIAAELIDTGVNMGPAVAATFLQRWLNALNMRGTKYADLTPDGQIGSVTLEALEKFLAFRGKANGVKVLLRGLNAAQAMRYLDIGEKNEKQEDFMFGWMLNRVS
jgi:lysozyme family protein